MARNKVRAEAEKRAVALIERHRGEQEIDPVRLLPQLEQDCQDLRRGSFQTLLETAWEDAVKRLTRERGTEQAWLPGFVPPDTVLAIGKKKIVYLDVATPDQFRISYKKHKENVNNVVNAFKPWQNVKTKILDAGYWTGDLSYPRAVDAYLSDHPEEAPPHAS